MSIPEELKGWTGSLALRVYELLLKRIIKLETPFPRISVYQKDADTYRMETSGINTYDNNKVDVMLTLNKSYGGIEAVDGKIVNNSGETKELLFDAVATVSDPSANNTKIWFSLFKNSEDILENTTSFVKLETQSGAGTLNAATEVELEDGEYLEIFCKTNKNNAEFNVDHVQLRLIGRS